MRIVLGLIIVLTGCGWMLSSGCTEEVSNESNSINSNDCQTAKTTKMETIEETCKNINQCCYCSCELEEVVDCDCSQYNLVRNEDTLTCEGETLLNAKTCLNEEASCTNKVKDATHFRCMYE